MLYPHSGDFRVRPAPRFGMDGSHLPGSDRPIRVCEYVDVRFLLEDMFAKIRALRARRRATAGPHATAVTAEPVAGS